ncbi:MAG: acetolactate synthase small subunit [Lachnospiraceae bacterium]|jgi:acetolactate synthase-1/3 small subunit|nr:acetolactate synthase small subunit [Lachnospiraceae bacterium]MBQ5474306.1 acetolactate synthase small subunit [Lachnospiraceae bacterium]
MKKMVLSILVENTSGVLSRVAGLFARRGYNIDSLTVSETETPGFSRMTIVCSGEDDVLEQIRKQLSKLVDVKDIIVLDPKASVCRELILVKIKVNSEQRQQIIAITDIFRAKVVDVTNEAMMIELTGNQQKLDAFINLLEGFDVLELVRTGITGLSRGYGDMLSGELD